MDFSIVLILGAIASAYMAWSIGANDVANAMGTSVGSRALTIRQAIVIAAVANLMGAVLVGGHVTKTIQSGLIVEGALLAPMELACGMLASLFAAAIWVTVATYLRLPVSTTHAIVGGVVGVLLLIGGVGIVRWGKVAEVVASWVISPTLAGVLAYALFSFVRARIIQRPDPVGATRAWGPFIIAGVFAVLCLVILYKGLVHLNLQLDAIAAAVLSAVMAALAGLLGWILIRREPALRVDARTLQKALKARDRAEVVRGLAVAQSGLEQAAAASDMGLSEEIREIAARVVELRSGLEPVVDSRRHEPRYFMVEKVFASIQVISATCVAFSQGANDVANAIGPFAAIREQLLATNDSLPLWVLLVGGLLIAGGIGTWGWRVIQTVGHDITQLTPTRGFSAEFACAATVLLASRLGLPISTTHCLVGAVLGVGLARGVQSLNWRVARSIVVSWLVTLPVAGILAVALAALFRVIST